jgi:hypothetical protein
MSAARRADWRCPLGQTFFGLTSEYKVQLQQEIFQLVTHGGGGWNWSDVYNLPVFLRRFYVSELIKFREMQRKANEGGNDGPSNKVMPPPFVKQPPSATS